MRNWFADLTALLAPPRTEEGRPVPPARDLVLVVLVALPVFCLGLAPQEPWLEAEERVWHATRNMLSSGDWLVPRLEGRPHLTKPPLVYWMGAATGRLLGRTDPPIIRLPSALCATVAVAATYLLGRNLWERRTGLLAAGALATMWLFTERAHLGTFDMPLTAAVSLALLGTWRWISVGSAGGAALLAAGAAAGFLIKGPVAWIEIGIPLVGCLLVRRELCRLASWRAVGLAALVLSASLPWFAYLIAVSQEARTVFAGQLAQMLGRTNPGHTALHYAPVYAYALWLPAGLLPWTAYVPAAVAYGWPRRRLSRQSPAWFPLIWAGGGLVFFSLVPAKQEAYLLPLYPAMALLIARGLTGVLAQGGAGAHWLRGGSIGLALLLVPGGLALGGMLAVRVGAPLAISAAVGLAAAVFGVALIWLSLRGASAAALVLLVAGCLLFSPVVYDYYLPRHQFIHERKDSAEARAYRDRLEHLRHWWQDMNTRP